jgi:hypothetical protein
MDWIERELEAAVRARSWEDDGLQVELESYRRLRTSHVPAHRPRLARRRPPGRRSSRTRVRGVDC